MTGATVHLVDETLDGGPIVAQEAVDDPAPATTRRALHERIKAVEHRLLPRAVALLLAGALVVEPAAAASGSTPLERTRRPGRRAGRCSRSRTRPASSSLGRGLVDARFELVSTGGTARALREAGLPVTDVAAVTASRRCSTAGSRRSIRASTPASSPTAGSADHREQLAAAAIAPFELVVVNLYPFAAAAERPGITFDELVEEIDIGGPSMVRAAAKNHASVAIVTSPDRYAGVLAAVRGRRPRPGRAPRRRSRSRRSATPPPTTPGSPPSCPAGWPRRASTCPTSRACPAPTTRSRRALTIGLEKVETLRYGENPHQPAARYRRPGARADDGPFATGAAAAPGQAALATTTSSTRRRRRRSPAALDGPALRDRQAHEPVRRRGARDARARRGTRRSPATRSRRSAASSR